MLERIFSTCRKWDKCVIVSWLRGEVFWFEYGDTSPSPRGWIAGVVYLTLTWLCRQRRARSLSSVSWKKLSALRRVKEYQTVANFILKPPDPHGLKGSYARRLIRKSAPCFLAYWARKKKLFPGQLVFSLVIDSTIWRRKNNPGGKIGKTWWIY